MISVLIRNLQAKHKFTTEEWDSITRIKVNEEKVHRGDLTEEEYLRRAVNFILSARKKSQIAFGYKSEFM